MILVNNESLIKRFDKKQEYLKREKSSSNNSNLKSNLVSRNNFTTGFNTYQDLSKMSVKPFLSQLSNVSTIEKS